MTANKKKTHDKIAKTAEDISMSAGIVSAVVSAGAAVAAPSGLSAIGVALGVMSPPLIVTAAPIIGAVATVAGAVSGGAYFYAKWKNRKNSNDPIVLSEEQSAAIENLEQAYQQGLLSEEEFYQQLDRLTHQS